MSNKVIETIKQWYAFLQKVDSTHQTHFKINIWVDPMGSLKKTIDKIRREFNGIATLRDINTEAITNPIIRYQIDQLRPNYGAASDVARYRILKKEKGLYLDTDVLPPTSTVTFIAAWKHNDVVMPDQFGSQQGMQCSDVVLNNASDNHPFIEFMVNMADTNYRVQRQNISLTRHYKHRYKLAAAPAALTWQQTYLGDTDGHRFEYTLRVNANLLISDWLETQYHKTGGPAIDITDMQNRAGYTVVEETHLRIPLAQSGSDISWRGKPVVSLDSIDEAITKACRSIQFEIEYKGILRLDDHIMNIIEAMNDQYISELEIVNQMLKAVSQFFLGNNRSLLNRINMAQLTFRFEGVEEFYDELGLLTKTCLFESLGDRINYNTQAIIKAAVQPFPEMHLLGCAEKLKAEGKDEDAAFFKRNYHRKYYSAKLGFLKGIVKFYYKRCQHIDLKKRLGHESILLIEKTKENMPVISSELSELRKSHLTEKQLNNIVELQKNIQALLSWVEQACQYRQNKETSASIINKFKIWWQLEPKLGNFVDDSAQKEHQQVNMGLFSKPN